MKTNQKARSEKKRPDAPRVPDYVPTLGESRLATMRWLLTNPDVLTEYAGKWVVLAECKVCLAGDAPDEIIAKAEEAGVPRSDMVVEYLEDEALVY